MTGGVRDDRRDAVMPCAARHTGTLAGHMGVFFEGSHDMAKHGTTPAGTPRCELRTERPHLPLEGGRYHLMLRLSAPEVRAPERQRPPLDLAVVVDRSGSMSGGKLELAKRGVEHALRLLDERDTISLVAYDDRIDVLTTQLRYSHAAHDSVVRRLRQLEPRGSTDLAGGWLAGCDQLAAIADGSSRLVQRDGRPLCRVLLLTDGLANVGMIDPGEIATHAAELRQRGIATTTFGVGDDFDEVLLGQMADAGGGRYHYIAHADEIPRVFAGELGELLAVAMRDVSVELRVPTAWGVELLNGLPTRQDGGRTMIDLGDLSSRDERTLIWEITLPSLPEGTAETIELSLRWTDPDGEHTLEQTLRHVVEARREPGPADDALLDEAVRLYGARGRAEALELNRLGRYGDANDTIRAYAMRMPATAAQATEIDAMNVAAFEFAMPLSPAELKARHAAARKVLNQQGQGPRQ